MTPAILSLPAMYQLLYAVVFCAFFIFVLVVPRQRQRPLPPSPPFPPDADDDGGDFRDDGLPDLDLPPGISLPINDWEPDYNRRELV